MAKSRDSFCDYMPLDSPITYNLTMLSLKLAKEYGATPSTDHGGQLVFGVSQDSDTHETASIKVQDLLKIIKPEDMGSMKERREFLKDVYSMLDKTILKSRFMTSSYGSTERLGVERI